MHIPQRCQKGRLPLHLHHTLQELARMTLGRNYLESFRIQPRWNIRRGGDGLMVIGPRFAHMMACFPPPIVNR